MKYMSDTPAQDNFEEAVARHAELIDTRRTVVKSYYRVRQALGYLGFSLPFLLIFTGLLSRSGLEPSVSDFFHTLSRDVFVGALFSIGTFLVVYEGYDRQEGESFADNWLATVAGIAVFGVALFPNESPTGDVASLSQQLVGINLSPLIHYSSCFVFFYCMGHFCMFRFSKTRDMKRRRIYRTCGWTIVVCCAALAVASIWKKNGPPVMTDFVLSYDVVFWIEAIGMWAFSFAWIVKGRGDQELMTRLFQSQNRNP